MHRRRLICFFLILIMTVPSLSPAMAEADTAAAVNWYEIFVRSFADSDADGLGDLRGVAGKLDYLQSLHIDGLWLMPVFPSPSYHKYDVTDYYSIDPEYGTMEDFRALLAQAHARGISVILDLPINHSSDQHPWFLHAQENSSPYRAYYNWSEHPQSGYTERHGAYYESRFTAQMPDLNLDSPAVRDEIENILRFWLCEIGVDGFRLDAVTSYYTGNIPANQSFLNWLADTAHRMKPGCYLVGEAWEGLSSLCRYADTALDSVFTFPAAQPEGYIAKVLGRANKHPGRSYGEYTMTLEESLPAASIPAPFTENHDTARTVGFIGRKEMDKLKMAAGLLCMMRGNVFVYYGQEIGMVGSGDDPNKRLGMLWTTEDAVTIPPPGTSKMEYVFPGVEAQDADSASLLNYYRSALALRRQFPAIARGTTQVLPTDNERICLLLRQDGDSSVFLAINPSAEPQTALLPDAARGFPRLAAYLSTAMNTEIPCDGSLLELPAWTIAIFCA